MSKRIFGAILITICGLIPYTSNAKAPDCEYCAYGCCTYGTLNGNGTANFVTECQVSETEWLYIYNMNAPAGACGS